MPGESITITAPLQGTVVQVPVAPGDVVAPGEPVVIIESMKMEHVVRSPGAGSVLSLATQLGDLVSVGDALALIETSGDPEVGPVHEPRPFRYHVHGQGPRPPTSLEHAVELAQ